MSSLIRFLTAFLMGAMALVIGVGVLQPFQPEAAKILLVVGAVIVSAISVFVAVRPQIPHQSEDDLTMNPKGSTDTPPHS